MSNVVALKAQPDWPAAAQILIDGCAHAAHAQARVDVLERLCMALGDALYPAFLNVLSLIGERGSAAAQSAVAEGLVDALRSGRLPAGKRAAWGGALPVPQPGARAPMVALGPIEYLCAVQLQRMLRPLRAPPPRSAPCCAWSTTTTPRGGSTSRACTPCRKSRPTVA